MSVRVGEFEKHVGGRIIAGIVMASETGVTVLSNDAFSLDPERARAYGRLLIRAADVADEEKERREKENDGGKQERQEGGG